MFRAKQRRLLGLYLLFTLAPAMALVGLGWRLLNQEEALDKQRAREHLTENAQFAATALAERMAISTQQVNPPPEGGLIVNFTPSEVVAVPPSRLLYYPVLPAQVNPSAEIFALAETLELRDQKYDEAATELRRIARSPDAAIQAGVMIRLARISRKAGRTQAAFDAYTGLAKLGGLPVEGVPAGLIAARARCAMLVENHRIPEARSEAAVLMKDLLTGRWPILRPAYLLHVNEAQQWASEVNPRRAELESLASAIDWLWQQWNNGRIEAFANKPVRRSMRFGEMPLALLWQGNDDRLSAIVATKDFALREWFEPVASLMRARGAAYLLRDADGVTVWSDSGPAATEAAIRNPAETNLPWTLVAWALNGREQQGVAAGRRQLLLGAFALLALALTASAYFVARAMSRELAVAQLHSDFVAAVSHEFRTPLTAMRQFTEFLQDKRVADEARRERYYEALARATARLQRLVETLLDFRRIEAGSAPYQLRALDAAEWIRAESEAFGREAAEAGYRVELAVNANGKPCRLMADPDALTRALWNLLDNAMKYSPDSKTIRVSMETNGERASFSVQDQGIGIPRDEQRLIFERFFRGAQAKTSGIRGTGIGLAMVHQIVRAHDGKIRLQSSAGEGSTFTIDLPIRG